jgi:nucleoside-diphosphate-sugar epimerase
VSAARARHASRADAPPQRVLVTGGSGYIGSHVVHALQATRAYKVVSLDNFHNAHPGALARVEALAREALPADASADDVESASVDHHKCDLTRPDEIDAVFARYGEGGIWGVVHIAVRAPRAPLPAPAPS